MSALSEDLRTLRLWRAKRRAARKADSVARAEVRAEQDEMDELSAIRLMDRFRPVPFALERTEGHDPDPVTACSCGDVPAGVSYREHLIRVMRGGNMLKVPGHEIARATGEGW